MVKEILIKEIRKIENGYILVYKVFSFDILSFYTKEAVFYNKKDLYQFLIERLD